MEKDNNMMDGMEGNDALTVYELSYLFLPNLSAENAITECSSIKDDILKYGGAYISGENPISIPLAYSMVKVVGTIRHKCDSGYFGWMKFEISQSEIGSVKKLLDSNSNVLRYLIIKTVKGNTLLNGKMKLKTDDKFKVISDEEGVPVPVDIQDEVTTVDLDKTIDDLVIA